MTTQTTDTLRITTAEQEKLDDFCRMAQAYGLTVQRQPPSCLLQGGAELPRQAAGIIAALCFGAWEKRWIAQLARQRYASFNHEELCLLQHKTAAMAAGDDFCWGLFAGPGRLARLQAALQRQLQQQAQLDIGGFYRFRLYGYREYLHTLLSIAADEVLSEQEDREYLTLLQQHLHEQPPGGAIHVYFLRQGMYDICCEAGGGLRFLEGGRLNGCEDMLVFSLMQLSPQTLTLHLAQPLPPALQHMLRDIFGPRLHTVRQESLLYLDNQGWR